MQDLGKIPAAVFLSSPLTGSASAQVVALGASNTEGHGVSSSESYSAQLQPMLQARGSGLRVTNAGVANQTDRYTEFFENGTADVGPPHVGGLFHFGAKRSGLKPGELRPKVAYVICADGA